ncbi:MAG: flagellin FliC [Candidatus Thiodiazotropha sp. (ex Lucinoma borealis)]|nr:flagellin FliC [Candidatus Thiodiazotropha sp. (ex Lucinoma borealis)]MCU7840808.1 flagellin FliC [Candidatus Thiodiazotropha sp. (ex Troendleina suluensis)]MCU7855703.1 flagellin FliC [Candidatus Thiodiazotropha sp. (ex Lucinoma borealis)]MCU7863071.1 flagellin FliC [Candidatus Thiodiazotropha sp. (ex Lucinoma borealis)]MCU7867286.1 flagellin FliC [Candidatus Thiodiazotropha sp. (ex Lucinoma borealis)]
MALTVNTNVFSLAAQKNLGRTQSNLETSIQRLSSGLRINMAKDDAAGLAVAQLQSAQARGLTVAQRNIADGTSFLNVADATLRSVSDMQQRQRELAVQAGSGLYTSAQTALMSVEFTALTTEITESLGRATFNGTAVFGGGGAIQVGANTGQNIDISTAALAARTAVITDTATIDADLNAVATALANVGGLQSRLEQAGRVAASMEEAQFAAAGRIMDADFARETAKMTSAQVVQQAGVAALAQANSLPQLALSLLR